MTPRPGVLVLAKAPVAGLAKTRVAADVGPVAAAEIAAACLLDTIDAVEHWVGPGDRTIALTGDLAAASRGAEIAQRLAGWRTVTQRGGPLGERIHYAHRDAAAGWGADRVVVQVGMDTPSLSGRQLGEVCRPVLDGRTDAAIGPAADGGWWGLVTAQLSHVGAIADVPMSRPDTGDLTLARLTHGGASVGIGPVLRDVDTYEDALAVARTIPRSHLAETLVRVAAGVS